MQHDSGVGEFRLPALAARPYSGSRATVVKRTGNPAEEAAVSRDYDPEAGQWYEDLDSEEIFKVLSVDPDEELVRIQWVDREIQDIDLDVWNEMDLELAEGPEGWADDEDDDEDDEDEDDEDLDEDEDDWDDDDDEDEDYDDEDDEYRDRE
jgi:hypothetical protein